MSEKRYADGYRKLRLADEPRRVAYEVLRSVTVDGAFANIILPKALRQARLHGHFSDRDAAFASELVHGTLRAMGWLDWVIARHVDRSLSQLDPRVLLRSITREGPGERETALEAIEDEDEALGVRYSHPSWMVRAFREGLVAHGYPAGELIDVLEADNEVPTVTLVARPSLMTVDELADEAEDILDTRVALGTVSPYAVLLESGDPARLPSIRDGRCGAQDEGSQLAALIAASAPLDGGRDERWLDLCAGPGGKAAMLAGLAAKVGARVTANEVHPHRARLVERTTRLFDSIEVVSGDGRSFGGGQSAWPLASFDRVIVDAPCSGMGSMRRRPESRWNRTPADVAELAQLQRELIDRAVALTRPGGVLTYITCSPHAAETREQVERLTERGEVELLDTVALANDCCPAPLDVPASAGVIAGSQGRTLQLWDHRFGTDLMFVACLRKR